MKNDEHLLNTTEIKNLLKKQSNEMLINLLIECTKLDPKIREYISLRFSGQDAAEKILETYKQKVMDVFFPKSMKAEFKIGNARKAVNDFKKLCNDKKLIVDLMLYYVEMGVEFTNTYGDIDEPFYNSIESMYVAVIKEINNQSEPIMFNAFSERLNSVVDDTSGIGWGFHDCLSEAYWNLKWLEDDDADIE